LRKFRSSVDILSTYDIFVGHLQLFVGKSLRLYYCCICRSRLNALNGRQKQIDSTMRCYETDDEFCFALLGAVIAGADVA